MAQSVAHCMTWICQYLASRIFKTETPETEPPEIVDIPERYLELTKSIMKQAQRTTSGSSPKFNHGQCRYLADKLNAAVDSAQAFLQRLDGRYKMRLKPKNMAKFLGVFKLLHAMAKESEGFIQACCKVPWIPAAVKLTNMSEHVSAIGFNLELCARVFESVGKAIESSFLSPDLVDEVRSSEAKTVDEKASLDKVALLGNVKAFCDKLSKNNPQLTSYLHKRLEPIGEEFCQPDLSSVTKMPGRLGSGGCASVDKGEWEGSVPVAMKVTRDGFTKFKKEVAIQSQLSHPNIVPLYCYGNMTLVMERMEKDLCSLIQNLENKHDHGFPFSLLVSVDLILQIGEGMRYLHEMEIVHRDLKSLNILVEKVSGSEYVLAKIADFGESKRVGNAIVNMTFNVGTLRWKAPEMIKSKKKEFDGLMVAHPYKCDIYSFAMVCYEIISGKLPFSDTNEWELKKKILDGLRPELPHRCPYQLKAMIERCWSAHPSKRPCFREICAELRHLKYVLLMTSLWGSVSNLAHEPSPNWYHSARIHRMMEDRDEFGDLVESKIDSSREYWSEADPLSQTEDVQDTLLNRRFFEGVKRRQTQEPGFFRDMDGLVVGEKIAEGGQAEIFLAFKAGESFVAKIFRRGMRGEELDRRWPPGMLNAFDRGGPRKSPLSSILGVTLLRDESFLDRFAIVQERCWGDLRRLVDERMMDFENQAPPISSEEAFTLMFGIAKDMASLHSESPPILHRDLKAANVLLQEYPHSSLKVTVADFECSVGVVGTGLWRAPEILQKLKDRCPLASMVFTDKCDVYSYGMTCYEIVTGRLPFEDFDYVEGRDRVLSGERPELPYDLEPMLDALIRRCWHPDPPQRPSFDDIVKKLSCRCIAEA